MKICFCFIHTALIVGTMTVAAGLLIYAVEVWHREGQRRQLHQQQRSVEGEHVEI